jgi:hypothetical protein
MVDPSRLPRLVSSRTHSVLAHFLLDLRFRLRFAMRRLLLVCVASLCLASCSPAKTSKSTGFQWHSVALGVSLPLSGLWHAYQGSVTNAHPDPLCMGIHCPLQWALNSSQSVRRLRRGQALIKVGAQALSLFPVAKSVSRHTTIDGRHVQWGFVSVSACRIPGTAVAVQYVVSTDVGQGRSIVITICTGGRSSARESEAIVDEARFQ